MVLKDLSKAKQWVRSLTRAHMRVTSQWIYSADILHPVKLELLPLRSLYASLNPPQDCLSNLFGWVRLPAFKECFCTSEAAGPYSKRENWLGQDQAIFYRALCRGKNRFSVNWPGFKAQSSPHESHPMAEHPWDLTSLQTTTSASG